jgi:hypothetical protein
LIIKRKRRIIDSIVVDVNKPKDIALADEEVLMDTNQYEIEGKFRVLFGCDYRLILDG